MRSEKQQTQGIAGGESGNFTPSSDGTLSPRRSGGNGQRSFAETSESSVGAASDFGVWMRVNKVQYFKKGELRWICHARSARARTPRNLPWSRRPQACLERFCVLVRSMSITFGFPWRRYFSESLSDLSSVCSTSTWDSLPLSAL